MLEKFSDPRKTYQPTPSSVTHPICDMIQKWKKIQMNLFTKQKLRVTEHKLRTTKVARGWGGGKEG